ncbi:MAG TPA: helix-turn-helix transcriptional regulator [Dehalococcoidia bacterium]|nr:helix-turn-helix transcriptional regulator [Dehalococcoidia bacterium]
MDRRDPGPLLQFGKALRTRRKTAGMSQAALAEAADLSDAYISQLERGRNSPSLDAIAALANALNTTAATLVAEAERNSP